MNELMAGGMLYRLYNNYLAGGGGTGVVSINTVWQLRIPVMSVERYVYVGRATLFT